MHRLIKKAMKDIWLHGKRTVLAFTAMTVGMIFFGLMLFSNTIITREVKDVYQSRNPASATMEIVGKSDTKGLEEILNATQGIESYEIKTVSKTQVKVGENDWKQAYVFGIPKEKKINQIKLTQGKFSEDAQNAVIETGAVSVAGMTMGDQIITENEASWETTYKLSGVANDMSVHPAIVHGCVYLYVPIEQVRPEQIDGYCLEYKTTDPYRLDQIEKVSQDVAGKLRSSGWQITEIGIPENPGESMHAKEYDSTLFILKVFSFVALLFGTMITANLISSIMDAQMKQIGILKSVGAKISQIYTAYLTAFGIHFLTCVMTAMVVVNVCSKYLAIAFLKLSDIIPEYTAVAVSENLFFFLISLIVPLVIVSMPLLRGSRISVRQAFDDHGITQDTIKGSKRLSRIKNRPIALSIRNVFRKKKRFILNISLLTFAGIAFISIVTVNLSLQADLSTYMNSLNYDYQFEVGANESREMLTKKLDSIDEIKEYEIWSNSI
ncbi:MAG: ABC transporter permease, partial [Clostridia bacterium]|nr:ABC transporter permease [Clostridia bacterium]